MGDRKIYRAIGLMSGTSLDGVDAALIETDGFQQVKALGALTLPYENGEKNKIRECFGTRDRSDPKLADAAHMVAVKHRDAIKTLLGTAGFAGKDIDVIGFHGQTVTHAPADRFSLQIGDASLLAKETGIAVVSDFRSADIKAGGQGAPLLPLYHLARAGKLPKPVAILNIGGVANVTWIGMTQNDILAFDTGPGNALIDDCILKATGKNFDEDGVLAQSGKVDEGYLKKIMAHPYFSLKPPKSLDRNAFKMPEGLVAGDEAATLTAFTVQAIRKSLQWFPEKPKEWIVAGGGRRNLHMMKELRKALGVPVMPVEFHGWNGDALEAEGFAYLAVRSLLKEPLSLPSTTGVPKPLTGGVYTAAA